MIIATHPGRHGDILWALPTVRALAEAYGEPVHLRLSAKYGTAGFCQLLRGQEYLASVEAIAEWQVVESAPIGPRTPPGMRGASVGVYHTGYKNWPSPDLPRDVWQRTAETFQAFTRRELPELDLQTPWLSATPWRQVPHRVAIGFTDEHFELKYGLVRLLEKVDLQSTAFLLSAPGSRWEHEADTESIEWVEAARRIVAAEVFLGCCSALHVLAVALGVPVICMEPNVHRHADVFYPLGKLGPEVTLVLGNDGQPTWDARHVADALQQRLTCGR